jgi:hypothetical protein
VSTISEAVLHPLLPDVIFAADAGKDRHETGGGDMARPRAADDFAAIRERMEELRRERVQATRDHAVEATDGNRQPMRGAGLPGKLELKILRERGRFSR